MQKFNIEEGPWRTQHTWVSPYNFLDGTPKPAKVAIHDSTLRDGEQAPRVVFEAATKLAIARELDAAGIDYIEAGFPAVGAAEKESVKRIANAGLRAKVTCLSRASKEDIDTAKECGVWGPVIEIPAGYPRIRYQFGWSEDTVIEKAYSAVARSRDYGLHPSLFLIDAFRATPDFLEKMIDKAVNEAGATRLTIVDTTGVATPQAINAVFTFAKKLTEVDLEVHCHNDFGLATANSLEAVRCGAVSISSTFLGLGQRAGNAPTEEIVMALQLLMGVNTGVDLTRLRKIAAEVGRLSGYLPAPHKAVAGANNFTWEAGIPVAALLKMPVTVEPFEPEIMGEKHDIVLGKKSGKANIIWKLKEMGAAVPDEEALAKVLDKIKALSIQEGRAITAQEFAGILKEEGLGK